MKILSQKKNLDFETMNSKFITDPLFGEDRGQMFGILVCDSLKRNSEPVILKAFSGQFNGVWTIPGWEPPLLNPAAFNFAVRRADPLIKQLTAEINSLPSNTSERDSLIKRRRKMSQHHMREIHELYTIRNFKGGKTDLFSLFNPDGIPAGTGDCCAPKLLNSAVLLGLKPLSLAEFYWGRENRSRTKQHGKFYPPCTEKCVPILGFMLQGAECACPRGRSDA